MKVFGNHIIGRILAVSLILLITLAVAAFLGLSLGPTGGIARTLGALFGSEGADPAYQTILWQIRLPRVLLAALVGGALSLGGLVF